MSDTLEQRVIFRELLGNSSAFSHRRCEIILRRIEVHILEMEDVLFHHDSCVMMPDSPSGISAEHGSEDDASDPLDSVIQEGQEQVAGLRALALVFKQFEFDPDKRLIVTGHTDTSGRASYNFELSDLRAENVLYLLIGDKESWADICYEKHNVEDYQQILEYVFITRSWPTNPNGVDDVWGDDTETATSNFITYYNAEVAVPRGLDPLPEHLVSVIRRDGRKRWPVELWRAVYEIYNDDLATALDGSREELESRRSSSLMFVDDSTPFVGCGESFPIDDAEKSNYRSQSNRRVELLFFDRHEIPEMTCPEVRTRTHREAECPLWHSFHYLPLYIDPRDLTSIL
ncbi:MAG: OmpA family protein, partial [Rhodothermales bacterium]|nr:OmpA family protein [Rhodothermales bacterium]